ncbi:MAG: ABC transporter ATP-binding protein [Methylobacteriaceae bacterium]|nr:ABC transporter ATP-binding protein [Methylobacteriaceae bacterium]
MSPPLLSIAGLRARRRDRSAQPILRDVSLTLAAGEVHGILGESGAGKSTVAKAILGLVPRGIRITDGRILLDGRNLLALDSRSLRRILGAEAALIPQDPSTALNPGRRVGAQLTDGLRLWRGLSAAAADRRALALLEEVQIREPARVMWLYPHELSGGMRQRVLIAAAFALEPKLVIADEPTTALDVTVQKQILRLIRVMQTRHRTAVLFVTHALGVAAQICDTLSLLFMGKVMEQGPAADILLAPRHAYTRALLAANPRHDRPASSPEPIPEPVIAACKAEVAAADRADAEDG